MEKSCLTIFVRRPMDELNSFWKSPPDTVANLLQTTLDGLTDIEAQRRLAFYGKNALKPKKRTDSLSLLIAQFRSPIIIILLFATGLSFLVHDATDALIILAIIVISSFLGFFQERGAVNAVQQLLSIVQVRVTILRGGTFKDLPIEEVVPGDILAVNAGDIIPGDCLILESKDLFADEATLTGETYPVEKKAGVLDEKTPLGQRTNTLFMSTHIISGSGKVLIVHTGRDTEFGKISEHLRLRPPETEFEHGVRRFGFLLLEVTLILIIAIFAINVYFHRPVLESFLFSLALAVGLTPQLLPAIISINLAHGAKRMADQKVIVKRLTSIENFGSMNILCSDKTGTLTEGVVQLHTVLDIESRESEKALLYAYINASYETGFTNPLDEAIRRYRRFDLSGVSKLDEVPYDFVRKRLSILAAKNNDRLMVTKGAFSSVLAICSSAETPDGKIIEMDLVRETTVRKFEELSGKGFRTLGLAYKNMGSQSSISKDDEVNMTFLGLLVFFDPLKEDIIEVVRALEKSGVVLKVVTGDSRLVAADVAKRMGLSSPRILIGSGMHEMSDEALMKRVNNVDIFAEIEPNQKERIILALRKSGNVVGYIGDGINDASALHAADVGISVNSAVDVAKEVADIVLLEKDLGVLANGVLEGRRTFSNTLKYVFMATSANFGNMFSMAGASLFLSFLPLLPKQILFTNLLTDFPEMTIATDSVDTEALDQPRRWNIGFIRNFMLVFGLLSSVFDYLTFGVLLLFLHASIKEFRTGWFMESVISASMIVLVIRTRRPFLKSRPGRALLMTTLLVALVTIIFPYTPVGALFGFVPIPLSYLLILALVVVLYIISAEAAKKFFYRRAKL
ncbi:MAG: Magnesium-transporting ATPase, P-type 1 [Syntrophorhabdus sp. PtaU1.Bin153]|nr:MAG: Magnesium-transporting ATPase, P-type 1 [Syntrophorhabdus sp. PtaU1.Bin153]